jgi:tripartite-type tricarboxylate transporter receptor subunit TctC
MIHRLLTALAALAALAAVGDASAQSYPARPVKIIVPFAAGGPADIYARTIGERLQAALGQSFVVENRPAGAPLSAPTRSPRALPTATRSS